MADFVICLYNPSSRKRHDYLEKACNMMLEYKAEDTICGIVRQIGRDGQESDPYIKGIKRHRGGYVYNGVYRK